jgi:hypothetical protein
MLKRILVWSALLLLAASCFAQKNEVDMVLGNIWSSSANNTISVPGFSSPVTISSGRDSNLTYGIGFARQLTSFGPASFSLELTAAGFPAHLSTDFASVFIVPAAKFSFLPRGTVSPFFSTGVGYVHLARGGFSATNAVAYQFGGGADVKTPMRFLKLRAEARDFLASQSGFGNFKAFPSVTPTGSSFRNHFLLGGGVVFRF